MNFLAAEKKRQTSWKLSTKYLPRNAKEPGLYRSRLYPFCLPIEHSPMNLFHGIREDAVRYFQDHSIVWHGAALPGLPSNHLCSSQIFCLNILYPFTYQPEALKYLLAPVFPDIHSMQETSPGRFLDFEWIGEHNYLNEESHLGGSRLRGAGNTSIDALAKYKTLDGQSVLLLMEWKYAEAYGSCYIRFRSDGTDRAETYSKSFFATHSPFNLDTCHDLDAFMYEPFYQLMRHQLMASEIMHQGKESVDVVKVAQFHARNNKGLLSVTSPTFRQLGQDSYGVWRTLIKDQSSFVTHTIDDLISIPIERAFPDLVPWKHYLRDRYKGIC